MWLTPRSIIQLRPRSLRCISHHRINKKVIHTHQLKQPVAFTAYIDNESVTDIVQSIAQKKTLPIGTPCYEIFYQIQNNLDVPNLTSTWKWVQGHQNDSNETKHILNVKADHLATSARTHTKPPPLLMPLESTNIIILQNNQPVHSNLKQVIHNAYVNEHVKQYYQKKWEWTPSQYNSIQWKALGSTLKNYPIPQRIRLFKIIHGWSNLGSKKKQIDGTPDTCPVCKISGETKLHLFLFPKQIHLSAWTECKKALAKIKTIPPS